MSPQATGLCRHGDVGACLRVSLLLEIRRILVLSNPESSEEYFSCPALFSTLFCTAAITMITGTEAGRTGFAGTIMHMRMRMVCIMRLMITRMIMSTTTPLAGPGLPGRAFSWPPSG
ncbi:hypothetical protein JCM14635_21720 [Megalodesulfovibrio paquesii]